MRDTSKIHDEIHVSQMHPERDVSDMKETCGIHAKYMRDTCILRGNQDTFGIHAEYMRNTCGIHVGYMWDTYLGGLGECIDAIMESSAPIRPPMSSLCRNGSAPTNTLQLSIFYFVMVTLTYMYPCWFTALVEREAQQLLLLSTERFDQGAGPYVSSNVSLCIRHVS